MATPIAVALLFLGGLLAGVFLGSAMVEHAVRRLDGATWVRYNQAKEAVFGPAMPPLFGLTLLVAIVAAVFVPNVDRVAAAALFAIVLAVTVAIHLPLNKTIQSWPADATPPAEWSSVRKRWRDWNVVRCLLAILAFALIVGCG